jgi:predicted secreted protein
MKKIICLFLLSHIYTGIAYAADASGSTISLTAQASIDVPNDEVVIHFRVEERGNQLDGLRRRVNQISAVIKKSLADEQGVKLETTSRRIDPIWQKDAYQRKREAWLVVQSGTITSKKLDDVPKWLNIIEQTGAKLQNLSFHVSDDLRLKTQEILGVEAIQKFRSKAVSVAKALGAKSFEVIRLSTGGSIPTQPMFRQEMAYMGKAMAAGSAPALSAGDSRLLVTVFGDIEVPRKRFKVD